MRSKAPLALMELLVMTLVLALAAALCVQAFAAADRLSERSAARDDAVTLAQNRVEELKRIGVPAREICVFCDASGSETGSSGPYRLEVTPLEAEVPGLCRAEVSVFRGEDALCVLPAAWQEVTAE